MKLNEKKNIINIVGSRSISRIGDIVFDFANTNFLAQVSTNSLMLLGLYQALENIIGVILNLLGGVIADRFKRKNINLIKYFKWDCLCRIVIYQSRSVAYICCYYY